MKNYTFAFLLFLTPCFFGSALAEEATPRLSEKFTTLKSGDALLQPHADVKGLVDVAKEPPVVEFAILPGQWEGARLWSSWGDALRATDGSVYVSIGDHDAPHGSAYVYCVDPSGKSVRQVVAVNEHLDSENPEHYTPGKIHGGLVEGKDKKIYFIGYRGSVRKTGAETAYRGDHLFQYDPASGKTKNLGIAISHCSTPVLHYHAESHSLYGLAAAGQTAEDDRNRFFHYDIASGESTVVFEPEVRTARAMILARNGRAYYPADAGEAKPTLARFDPRGKKSKRLKIELPGSGVMRAATGVNSKGVAYGITKEGELFAFDTNNETCTPLGTGFPTAPQYTAAMKLDATERYLYYVPGAHGRTDRIGTPVMQFDLKTKRAKAICFLHEALLKEHNYFVGGTYGLVLSEDGSRLTINFNGGRPDTKQPSFGLCSVMIVHIPESERPE